MDIRATLAQFHTSLAGQKTRPLHGVAPLLQGNPQLLSNRSYRNALISSNIYIKAVQLYTDLVLARHNTSGDEAPALSSAADIRKSLEVGTFSSLNDILKSHLSVHISDLTATRVRGGFLDRKQ